tara:strand:- start:2793 stop:3062 length:270 start_codon:yes stop_codon:yes gene_type:complete
MNNNYNEVGRWSVGTPDGNSEEMILEKNKEGYRLRNDFGNVVIEFDKMSAKEFFKKLNDTVNDSLEQDLFDWFANDADTDCDGDDWGTD